MAISKSFVANYILVQDARHEAQERGGHVAGKSDAPVQHSGRGMLERWVEQEVSGRLCALNGAANHHARGGANAAGWTNCAECQAVKLGIVYCSWSQSNPKGSHRKVGAD